MNIKHILLTAATFLLLHGTIQAEGIGTWRAYMAYHDITDVQQGGQTLYVLASNGLYTYYQTDQSIRTYDKANGLNDCEISFIKWNGSAKKLLVVYSNGNIDMINAKGEVSNLSDYYNKSMTEDKTVNHIDISGQHAYLSTQFGIVKVDMQKEEISETYNLGFSINYTYIENGYIYAASSTNGLYRAPLTANRLDKSTWSRCGNYESKAEAIDSNLLAIAQTLSPGGPRYNHFGSMKFKNNQLYTVVGGYSAVVDKEYPGAVQVLRGDDWTFFEEDDIAEKTGHLYRDPCSIDVDPTDQSHVAVGARTGLYEFKDGNLLHHWSSENSQLYGADKSVNYTLVLATAFDKEGNLWCFNSLSPSTTLMEYSKDGNWTNHHNNQLLYNGKGLGRMNDAQFDSRGILWAVNNFHNNPALICYQPSTDGLVVYNSFVNEDGATLTPNYVRCVAEDRSGNMWIGTTVGPLMLETGYIGQAASEVYFNQVKVPRNDGTNYADYLLSGIDISAIAVDGAGRKWFGTNGNGVYLISEDNYTQVEHFLSSNSPLLSNNIESIAINGETGEVFFGTDKGLCSYMSDATTPNDEMTTDNVWAYPNPVGPDYTGLITVTGLSYDADVKIVSASGALVNQGRSNGGTYTWDGRNQRGKRVASGVYMVETASSDGSKGTVCKIAIVR